MPPDAVSLARRQDGDALLANLRASEVEVLAAFWWLAPGPNEWRLVIVSPEVETRGPRDLLRLTHKLLGQMDRDLSFTFFDVDYRSPHSSQILMLAVHQQVIGFGRGTLYEANTVNGIGMPDAYFIEFDTTAILKANEPLSQLAAE